MHQTVFVPSGPWLLITSIWSKILDLSTVYYINCKHSNISIDMAPIPVYSPQPIALLSVHQTWANQVPSPDLVPNRGPDPVPTFFKFRVKSRDQVRLSTRDYLIFRQNTRDLVGTPIRDQVGTRDLICPGLLCTGILKLNFYRLIDPCKDDETEEFLEIQTR